MMNEALRVESADLEAQAFILPSLLPIRAGRAIVGKVRIEKKGDQFFLDLGVQKKLSLKTKTFFLSSRRTFCLSCPLCKRWRKRLFLVDSGRSFRCQDCSFKHQ